MEELLKRLDEIKQNLAIEKKREEIKQIKKESEDASFWQYHQKASEKMQELSSM